MRLLRRALAANAAFSGLSGGVFVLAGGPIAGMLGEVPPVAVRVLGVGLLLFAALVAALARRPRRGPVLGVVFADTAWVAGSLLLVVLGPGWLTASGRGLVAGVAGVVATLAALQAVGLRVRPPKSGRPLPRP